MWAIRKLLHAPLISSLHLIKERKCLTCPEDSYVRKSLSSDVCVGRGKGICLLAFLWFERLWKASFAFFHDGLRQVLL